MPYPNDHFRLGRYLGPSIDIGPALMAMIIKKSSQVLHRSMYQTLTQDDGNRKSAKLKVAHSWSLFTRGWVLMPR